MEKSIKNFLDISTPKSLKILKKAERRCTKPAVFLTGMELLIMTMDMLIKLKILNLKKVYKT